VTRTPLHHRAAALCALAAVLALPTAARAEDPRRSIAVLEFRSDSSALPEIGARFAALLGSRTSLKVLGDDQARQRYGNALDGDVVACDGEARCIGRIGQKLGVAEILLVGVSELGDVILTVQRIDSKSGKVKARLAEALAADSAPEDDGLVVYLGRVLPAEDFIRFGTIVIKVNVAGAEVIVGGQPRGNSPIPDLRVPAPATYPIEVKKLGYLTFRAEVDVPPDANLKVNATLTKPGQGGGAWYSKWYVGAVAGVIIVGAATGTYFLTRERDSVPIGGEIQ
jgi:hypothetical protein